MLRLIVAAELSEPLTPPSEELFGAWRTTNRYKAGVEDSGPQRDAFVVTRHQRHRRDRMGREHQRCFVQPAVKVREATIHLHVAIEVHDSVEAKLKHPSHGIWLERA